MNSLWKTSRSLTAAGAGMLAALLFALAGLALDSRIITGMPAWLKPAKFALSTAIYCFTLAWLFRYLKDWPRLRAWTGWMSAAILVMEVALIFVQAGRGTTSHFNTSTAFDGTVFMTMGIGIGIVWGASVAILVALFLTPIPEPGMRWALRLGMLITVAGAATGGIMVQPTDAQLKVARLTHQLPINGAHTVGAPDGGPGARGTGWSRDHGDLRVPHFLGLHAIQILPLFAWLAAPRRASLVIAAGLAYAAVFGATLLQALAGQPFLPGLL